MGPKEAWARGTGIKGSVQGIGMRGSSDT